MMADTDHRAAPAGSPDGERPGSGWFGRLCGRLQDRLWRADKAWAARQEYTARRSVRGWVIDIRDPRFDRRHVCDSCGGTGCAACVDGVITDPERGER